MISKNTHLSSLFSHYKDDLCKEEGITISELEQGLNSGSMVLLGNINHKNVKPLLIGQPAKIKINANIGTSPLICSSKEEMEKLKMVEKAGADTYMDLSTGGNLDEIRKTMISSSHLPIGTVPIYAAAKKLSEKNIEIENMDMEEVFDEIERQAEQGVDFMTIHTGIDMASVEYAEKHRVMGVVSRGGSMIARWMKVNKKENPFLVEFDRIVKIAKKYNVTLSLGDGMRPGALADSSDYAQMQEVLNLGQQVLKSRQEGVQVMVEGPGHVPLNQVKSQTESIKLLTHNAPLYVLGPLVIDNGAGYDHISAAIGASVAVMSGVDYLCYVTPAEHLSLPNEEDVYNGIIASRIAAAAGETALNRKLSVDIQNNMSKARSMLDWKMMEHYAIDSDMVKKRRESHKDKEECAMCGEFCSIKLKNKDM